MAHVGSLSLSQFFLPFNSHEWPRQNFSLQYQHSIKQTSDENKEEYQLGDYYYLCQLTWLQQTLKFSISLLEKKKKRKQINWFFRFLPVLTFASVSSYESLKNIQPDACLASCYRQLKDWKWKHHTIKIISFNELYNLLTEVRCHSFLNLNFLFPFF